MNGLGKIAWTLTIWVVSSVIAEGLYNGIKNLSDGKDFFGKEKIQPQNTYTNYKDDVILGKNDYQIV